MHQLESHLCELEIQLQRAEHDAGLV
ncbi:MAG: hypothetical protein RLZZ199_790, partial [Actinomycetota bacterium]